MSLASAAAGPALGRPAGPAPGPARRSGRLTPYFLLLPLGLTLAVFFLLPLLSQ